MKRFTLLALAALFGAIGFSSCSLSIDTSELQSGSWELSKENGVDWTTNGYYYTFSNGNISVISTVSTSFAAFATYTISGGQITIVASGASGLANQAYNVTISSSLMDWYDPYSSAQLYEFTK
jgi:hypothetical protein